MRSQIVDVAIEYAEKLWLSTILFGEPPTVFGTGDAVIQRWVNVEALTAATTLILNPAPIAFLQSTRLCRDRAKFK